MIKEVEAREARSNWIVMTYSDVNNKQKDIWEAQD